MNELQQLREIKRDLDIVYEVINRSRIDSGDQNPMGFRDLLGYSISRLSSMIKKQSPEINNRLHHDVFGTPVLRELKKYCEYIRNAGVKAKVCYFDDDWAPIGYEVRKQLKEYNLATFDDNNIESVMKLTEDGKYLLK